MAKKKIPAPAYDPPDLTGVRVHSREETQAAVRGIRKRRGPQRPAGFTYLDPSKVTAKYRMTVYLEPYEIDYLTKLGEGSRSRGIRQAIAICRDTIDHLDLTSILQLARKTRER